MNSPATSVTDLGHVDEQSSRVSSFGGKLVAKQFGTFSTASVKPGLPPWRPHVRFHREQTLVREGSPLVKLRNSA